MVDERGEPVGEAISALAGEGEHVADGHFTIDAEAAVGKLEQFQLSEVRRWPVFLVEVAYLLDAGGIDFHFGGWVVSAQLQLADVDLGILDLLERFGENRAQDDPARLLGLVFRSVRQTGADAITITAVDAEGQGRRCKWSAGGYARFEACAGEPGLSVWVRFADDGEDEALGAAELDELNRRCRASSFPISIDGQPSSIGPVGAFSKFGATQVSHSVPVELDGVEIGLAGVYETPRRGRLLFMQHGVAVEIQGLPESFDGLNGAFTAVVEVGLRRDLSMTKFVRGAEFDRIMAAITNSYTEVRAQSRASALALRDGFAPTDVSEVDPSDHAADLQAFARGQQVPGVIAGRVSIGLALASWLLGVLGAPIPITPLLPVILLGIGIVLVLRRKFG